MKIFIICSKVFYGKIPPIQHELERMGHEIVLPNSYDNPNAEKESHAAGDAAHLDFKRRMFERSRRVTRGVDAVLTLNFEKNGTPNYIGGATFLELYDAYVQGKTIYLWNNIPQGILYDEIHGFAPVVLGGDLSKIEENDMVNQSQPSQFRDPQLETSGGVVGFYPREFYVFDNFSSFAVEHRGRLWPTSEHAYQASHFFETAPGLVEQIHKARSAHEAYKIAKANADKSPENWDEIKIVVMEEIVRAKCEQNSYVKQKLLDSGDLDIVEDSPKDDFWGWGEHRNGRNELGKIWMRLRDELREEKG
jgi:ribA/ribD-fused uncharacterized protein